MTKNSLRMTVIYAAALSALASVPSEQATAIEIACIEASRYKYLYRLFNDDRRLIAEYLGVARADLPHPEACRAILLHNSVVSARTAKSKGERSDPDKLLDFIERNRGWLATVYLGSGGGAGTVGFQLGQITRTFWLKTVSLVGKPFVYYPDFIPMPVSQTHDSLGLLSGQTLAAQVAPSWKLYAEAVEPFAQLKVPTRRGRCASACTFIHVAGIDRRGLTYVHRGRSGNLSKSDMSKALEGAQRHEARVTAWYVRMDAGEEVIYKRNATPTQTVVPALASRTPRYVADILRARCKVELAELEAREITLAAGQKPVPASGRPGTIGSLQTVAEVQARRIEVERCAAAEHETQRLAQFARYCANGKCDRRAVGKVVRSTITELEPPRANSETKR